jgi:hypothetical protein
LTELIDQQTERCGACGAVAPADAELCPSCGALLDAYRTPSLTDPLSVAAPASVAPPPFARPASNVEPNELERRAELDEARRTLLSVLSAPKRELVQVVELIEEKERAGQVREEPTPPRERPAPGRVAAPRPVAETPGRRAGASYAPTPQPPRRPGYIVRGTVEPMLVIGICLVLFGCVGALAAAGAGRNVFAGLASFVVAIGVMLTIAAVLVALVRRDNERR